MRDNKAIGLLLLGAVRRAAIAAIVMAALWALFFWATYTPGSL